MFNQNKLLHHLTTAICNTNNILKKVSNWHTLEIILV